MPLLWGVLITIFDTFLFLLLQRLGMRKMEAFIICLVAIIGLSFLFEIILAKPDIGEVATGFIPSIPNDAALYIAIGIIGATVMPHNLYLHSALVQTRKIKRDEAGIKRALKLNFIDSAVALNMAFFVNAAILVLAATVFYKTGRTNVAEIKQAHELLAPMLGTSLAPTLFAIALIASGQSSTITGTLAGQIVMEGYLRLRINPWVRRLMTRLIAIIPAFIVILINGEKNIDSLLVLSQVILSLQLGFAIIPLIHFTSNKKMMGQFAIKPLVIVIASLVTAILVYLNIRMVVEQASSFFASSDSIFWKIIIILSGLFYLTLLLTAIFYPMKRRKEKLVPRLHADAVKLEKIEIPSYQKIAIALDLSESDRKLISHAIGQGNKSTSFLLIHVVESASAKMFEQESDDLETRKDLEHLDNYVQQLKLLGFTAEAKLGFGKRVKEIVRLVKESNAGILVIGAHGHSGMKDLLYGQTTDNVRHELKIPLLVVNV
jgi:manganese transport protein